MKSQMSRLRADVGRVVFNADSPAGRLFDTVLIFLILASVGAVMLDSVRPFAVRFRALLSGRL